MLPSIAPHACPVDRPLGTIQQYDGPAVRNWDQVHVLLMQFPMCNESLCACLSGIPAQRVRVWLARVWLAVVGLVGERHICAAGECEG